MTEAAAVPGRGRYHRAVDRPPLVLVVDDDAKIVRLVRVYLEREGLRVGEAADGRSALRAIDAEPPSLVILDRMLPEVEGLDVLAAIRRDGRTPVIILSARGTTADRITGLSAGADDYLPKPFSPAELVLRVRRVLDRAAPPVGVSDAGAPDLQVGDLVVDRGRHEARLPGGTVPLTATEFRLLVALLDAGGRVLTRDQLLDAVYGAHEADVLDRTIDANIRRLRVKLGDDVERPAYIETVRGVGYRAQVGAMGRSTATAAPEGSAAIERSAPPTGSARPSGSARPASGSR